MKKRSNNDDVTNYNSNLKITTTIGNDAQNETYIFIFLKPKTKFKRFGWTAKTCENVILYVTRFIAIQLANIDTKAKHAIYYCSTSESLSLLLEE